VHQIQRRHGDLCSCATAFEVAVVAPGRTSRTLAHDPDWTLIFIDDVGACVMSGARDPTLRWLNVCVSAIAASQSNRGGRPACSSAAS